MNWENLEDGNCPKCGKQLENDVNKQQMVCKNGCYFRISNEKFQDITSKMAENEGRRPVRQIIETPEEQRQRELNNL